MFNLGPFELVAIFVVALLVFGPDKLPEMGRQVGKAVREFRKFQASMQSQVRDVIDPITGPIVSNGPVGPPPTNVRDGGAPEGSTGPAVNVPRSAAIQNREPAEGEAAAAPGTYGYYADPSTPAPQSPQNGPAPAGGETAPPAAAAGESAAPAPGPAIPGDPTPPDPPSDPDPR
ncbi:MAG TPA: twin-arginine translocase TatA/TatE family subunit [Acidimicrobiia bacterium]|nr:twin-arginine translocase TatA/TatE family subunit [Acidimicrobiia bacterium]